MDILIIKSVHVLSMTSWIFVLIMMSQALKSYHKLGNEYPEMLKTKMKSLYQKVAIPLMILGWVSFISFLLINPNYLKSGYVHTKLLLVVYITVYHHVVGLKAKKIGSGKTVSLNLRLLNQLEVFTLLVFVVAVISGVVKF